MHEVKNKNKKQQQMFCKCAALTKLCRLYVYLCMYLCTVRSCRRLRIVYYQMFTYKKNSATY